MQTGTADGKLLHIPVAMNPCGIVVNKALTAVTPVLERLGAVIEGGYTDFALNQTFGTDNYDSTIMAFYEGNMPFYVCTAECFSGMKKRESKSKSYSTNPFEHEFIYAPVGDNGAGVYTSAADAAKAFVASCKAGEYAPCVNPSAPAKGVFLLCCLLQHTGKNSWRTPISGAARRRGAQRGGKILPQRAFLVLETAQFPQNCWHRPPLTGTGLEKYRGARCVKLAAWAMRAPRWERRSLLVPGGAVGQMVKELNRNPDEVRLLIRRKDMLPVYAVGDMEALLGIRLEDLQGDVATLLPQLADPAAGRALWKSYAAWDGAQELTDELHMKNGEWIYVDVRRGESDTVDVATLRRSTTLHQQIEKFEKSLQKAEEASQSKTTFLSRMSHEIRTPMNGIIGMLTLAEDKLTPDSPAMQYLHKADELSDHLLSLINDILDMSRIEAGKVELEEKPFSLRALGQKLYDMFAKNLEACAHHAAHHDRLRTTDGGAGALRGAAARGGDGLRARAARESDRGRRNPALRREKLAGG